MRKLKIALWISSLTLGLISFICVCLTGFTKSYSQGTDYLKTSIYGTSINYHNTTSGSYTKHNLFKVAPGAGVVLLLIVSLLLVSIVIFIILRNIKTARLVFYVSLFTIITAVLTPFIISAQSTSTTTGVKGAWSTSRLIVEPGPAGVAFIVCLLLASIFAITSLYVDRDF